MSPATRHLVIVPRSSVEAVVDYFGPERPRGVPDLSAFKAALAPPTLTDGPKACVLERAENGQMLAKARQYLGFQRGTMANLLGYRGKNASVRMKELETGHRAIPASTLILMTAYVRGYRPDVWPERDIHLSRAPSPRLGCDQVGSAGGTDSEELR